jgi:outer membrane protein
MHAIRPSLAIFCTCLLLAQAVGRASGDPPPPGQDPPQGTALPGPLPRENHGFLGRLEGPYQPRIVPPAVMANSNRLESLLRAGNLYLSMQDSIALALENNLDIAIQRYGPALADAAVLQTEAGAFARGVSTTITPGPSSATVLSSGTTPGNNQASASEASAASASAVGASILQQSGASIPLLDPMLIGGVSWGHFTTLEPSTQTAGGNSLVERMDTSGIAVQQSFLTGTTVNLALNNTGVASNDPFLNFNPSTSSSVGLSITQPLLQGFGRSVNAREIHIARNNREVADLTFKLQVETTVAAVMELYWDLVSFNENVRVAQEAVSAATRLYEDNQRQVAVGTLAPLEVTRAEAEIAAGQQQLTAAQTQVLQQETIIKTALSRTGVANPSIADAHIIPTDPIRIPDVEAISPIQDMTAMALASRPELAQSRIQVQNQQLTIRGSRNALLPSASAVVNLTNSALAGQANSLAGAPRNNSGFFVGGYGTVLSQLFARNFPSYSLGFNVDIPIRNRSAQAQVINDELTLRQQQLALQRLENQVRVDVQNAVIGLTQARALYQAASKARLLQAQTLDAEQKKLAMGASTVYNVIQDQQALTAAESTESAAKATYAKARVELDRATGEILTHNNISMDEAFRGAVSRPPSPIPAIAPRR